MDEAKNHKLTLTNGGKRTLIWNDMDDFGRKLRFSLDGTGGFPPAGCCQTRFLNEKATPEGWLFYAGLPHFYTGPGCGQRFPIRGIIPPIGILFIIFIISRICSNCFMKPFTSEMSLPEPLAIRLRRLPSMESGLARS